MSCEFLVMGLREVDYQFSLSVSKFLKFRRTAKVMMRVSNDIIGVINHPSVTPIDGKTAGNRFQALRIDGGFLSAFRGKIG